MSLFDKTSPLLKLHFSLVALFLLTQLTILNAQTVTQTIRGRVVDAISGKPLVAAKVSLNSDSLHVVETDKQGAFVFKTIVVGRHLLRVSFVGYEKTTVSEVLVESGKETIVEVALKPSATELETFTVATSVATPRSIYPSVTTLEKARYQFPATFADPARYASYAAGVSVENDQANNISIRGIAPSAMQWYLEGAEIVNPNHLSNAGTLSDRASASGGGVMILSANVLDNSTLFAGITPPQYANALAGGLDMKLRKGNADKKQTSLQASLIGFDVTTEGGFSKKSKASYLINYRYSFTGLLNKLGVNLGDEVIDYQDISVHLNFPTKRLGTFSVFGTGGQSSNDFFHKSRTDWKVAKDSQDIFFSGLMYAVGFKHQVPLSKNISWRSVGTFSALKNDRKANGFGGNDVVVSATRFRINEKKYFFRTELNGRFSGVNVNWSLGSIVKYDDFASIDETSTANSYFRIKSDGLGTWAIPFAELSGGFAKKWAYQIGFRSAYFSLNNQVSPEPSANLRYNVNSKMNVQLAYGRQSQILTPKLFFRRDHANLLDFPNQDFVKSDNLNLTANWRIRPTTKLSVTAFYQYYFNLLADNPDPSVNFFNRSILDYAPENIEFYKTNLTATSKGVSLNVQQDFEQGWFGAANATFFDAKNSDGFDLRFNTRYITNAFVGKEWHLGKAKNRFFGTSVRSVLRGGNFANYYDPIKGRQRVAAYQRIDLNLYLKTNHKSWHSTIQIDIQNVGNRENEWDYYYDFFQRKTLPMRQLGLIPNASYKVEF